MRKQDQIKQLLLCICLVTTSAVYSTNYYFSESLGNDAWSGTLPAPNVGNTDGPKRTLTALNTFLDNVAQAGDSILLRRGDTWSGSTGIAVGAAHGTASNYIVIGSYGTGNKPVISKTGLGEVLNCRGSANYSSSYLKFQNLTLTTSSPSGSRPTGVNVNESFYTLKPHHITFDNLEIKNCMTGMILYQQFIIVENCLLEKNGNQGQGHGIFSSADDVIFRNNVLDSNGCGSFFVHTMYISQCNNVLFEGNEIKNADDGLKLRSSTNLMIRNNVIHDMYIHTIHMGGDNASGTSNITIDRNIIYNAPQGLMIKSESGTQTALSENITIKNNIFPAQVEIASTCPVKDIYIYNNLIHSTNTQNQLLLMNSANPINVQIKNNIFYKTSANANHSLVNIMAASGLTGVTLDNNLYYFPAASGNIIRVGNGTYTTLTAFKVAYPTQEINGQQGNPNFAAVPTDFHLTSNSALAIDKGADLTGVVDWDLDSLPRPIDGDGILPASWDIGPYEYSIPIGVHTLNKETEISAFPIPTSGQITISTSIQTPHKIIITDILGKIVLERSTTLPQNALNLENLNNGMYFIHLFSEKGVHKVKIIKQE